MPSEGSVSRLPLVRKFSYGVGHVLNDLCASMWFTYLLIFYHQVLGMDNILAGNLLLLGQVADALATPFVGYESDRLNGCFGYGKRKSWHLLGSICVAASFIFVFSPELGVDPLTYVVGKDYTSLVYYAPFIVIFQFGWASTQISHLSLIPSLSNSEQEKLGLNSIRYAFTVIANLAVYLLAWFLLTQDLGTAATDSLTSADYLNLAIIVIATGALFSLIFHVGTKESIQATDERELMNSTRRQMRVLSWLKTAQFYTVALLYMSTRLIVNISQVYLSMYLTETLMLSKTYIAIVPLVIYIMGFLITFPIKFLSKKAGKKVIYFLGLLCIIGACTWFYFLHEDTPHRKYLVMGASALNGIGGSTVLVISLSLTADLIDGNTESAAFVYGAMSFTDKLANGLAVQIIQIAHPCKATACCPACSPFYRDIMSFVPAGCAVTAFIALLLIRPRKTEYTYDERVERSDSPNLVTNESNSINEPTETSSLIPQRSDSPKLVKSAR
ncbi:major facilitator superfamily domain-containing protein 12-like isoform X2 [Watersipora subatra]|uniref:major facilitator superfamily domain-containing protein 12-like isoform X2 n=1 Tax=Watersipora subatra TaxID=2589382 RepID=UPI00355B0885